MLVALALIINRTRYGRAMRAVAENPEVAAAQGISVDRTILITVVGASVFGGISGLLFAADSHVATAFMGLDYGLKGLVVMIVGGVGMRNAGVQHAGAHPAGPQPGPPWK